MRRSKPTRRMPLFTAAHGVHQNTRRHRLLLGIGFLLHLHGVADQ
jgi:hypothetical protein